MTNVIDFAAALNARRAAAKTQEIEANKAARYAAEQEAIAQDLGGTFGAHMIASVAVDLKAREDALKNVPAYCDPNNEVRGSKYEATRDLTCKQIAERIRNGIKDALKSGHLPKGLKVRCYMPHDGSIQVKITALPADVQVLTDEAASWFKQRTSPRQDYPGYWSDTRSDELKAIIQKLEAIHGAYNRDNSDGMTDYFDRRYYGTVNIDTTVRLRMEAEQIEANPGTHWAASCFE